MRRVRSVSLMAIVLAGYFFLAPLAQAGVEETVRETILRLKQELPAEKLLSLTSAEVAALLTDEERAVLGGQYLTFRVDVPVTVIVAMDPGLREDVFWLREGGFEETEMVVKVGGERRLVWRKNFPEGQIGLGVNSLRRRGDHYFVILAPQIPYPSASATVTNVAPPIHTVGIVQQGAKILADDPGERITEIAEELKGQVLLRGHGGRTHLAHIAGTGSSQFFRTTSFPSTERPDGIVVTMGADPKTSMTVQWRTSTAVTKGAARYQKKELVNRFFAAEPLEAVANTVPVEDLGLVRDPLIHRHFVTLTDLEPATTYVYSVGDAGGTNWSEFGEFTTAPAGETAFSFIYMGDIQQGYDLWSSINRRALLTCPDAAFCLTAGDQVNRGMFRDHWDALFHYAGGLFANVPMVPAIGNHEMYKNQPELYLDLFHLPHNGPAGITPERAYAFEYGQALVAVLDTNLDMTAQVPWLEQRLASSDAVWKFVLYHHPAYSSAAGRDGTEIRKVLAPVFDKHGVDVAFQGHDHGYLRTYPMKNGQRVEAGARGTVYLVTSSGTKMYDVVARDYSEVVMERTTTFQVVDITVNPHRLVYRAYDVDGNKLDEFEIQK